MDYIKFKSMYADALRRHPNRFNFGEPPSAISVIDRAEKEMESIFPESYRTFTLNHGSGELAFVIIYSPESDSFWSIAERNREIKGRCKYFAVSEDQCGNYYGFLRDGSERMFMFDHDTGEWMTSPYENLYAYFSDLSFRE